MSTWSVIITISGTPTDITSRVEVPSIVRTTRLHTEMRANVNRLDLRAQFDSTLWAALVGASEISISVTKDGAAYFTGVLSPNFETEIADGRKYIAIIAEDYTLSKLGKTISAVTTYAGYAVSTPAATATSLLHAITTAAGVTLAAGAPTISSIVPYVGILPDDKMTWGQLLDAILFEYGYVYYFLADGTLALAQTVNTGTITTTNTFSVGTNIRDRITAKKSPEKYDDIRINFKSVELQSGLTVFEDTSGGDASYPCRITLNAAGDADGKDYYPPNSGTVEVFSEWRNPDGKEIWIVTIAALHCYVPADVTLSRSLTNYFRRCSFAYHNAAGATREIHRIKVGGVAYVITARNVARSSITGGKALLEHDAKYLFDKTLAENLAKSINQYYAYSHFSYELKSKADFSVGEYVQLTDSSYSGISQKCRIIGKIDSGANDVISYYLEAVADYSSITITTESVIAPVTNQINTMVEASSDPFPPTTNLVSHYSFDGVPAIPDRTAGATYYRRNNFTSSEIVSSGANGIGTFSYFESAGWHPERVTVSSGALKISAQASANILRYGWNKSAAWIGFRVKTCADVTLFLNNDGNDQNFSCKANTWRSYLGYFANAGQNFIDIENFPIGDNYIDMYYIGDGTYNPILDNAAGQFNSISMAGVFPYIGISGNALYFDGTNSYPVGLGPYHNTDGGSHTLSAWFKWNDQSSATYQTLSGILGRAGWHHGLMLDRATKKAVFLFLNTVPAETKPATTTSVNDGNWHHLCGVVDNTAKTVTLYLDGVQEAQSSYTGNPYQDTAQGWSIGGFGNPGVNYAYLFGGYIDECRIYNIALSSVQVRALYKQITMGNAFSQADYYNNLLPGSALRPVAWKPTWLTDMIIPSTVDGVLAKLVDVPSSAGMWYGETYMGYRDAGGVWRTYIDNSGYFKFGNADSSRYLKWDGSTFEISGKINLVDAAGATPASAGLYVASDKLGFYQTTGTPGWRAYLDNTGKFYAGDGGSTMGTNKFISWDLSDLKVSGNFKLGASCFLENGDGLIRLTYDNPASVWGGEGLVFVSNNRAFVAATAQIGDNRWSIQKVGSGQYADYLELCTVAGAFNNTYVVGTDRTISSSSASLQDTVFCSSSYGLRYLRIASSTAAAHRWDVTFTTEKSIAFAKDGTGTFLYPLSSAIDLGKSAARWNTAYTTYCDVLSYINLGGAHLYPGSPGVNEYGLGLTWNYSGSLGEVDLVCAQQGGVGGFNFYKNGNAGTMGLLAYIDSAGNVCSQNYFRMTGGYVANPTVDGALWIDSTQKALSTYLNSRTHYDVGCLYSQYTTVTVANSNSQTTLIGGSSIGTNTIGSYNSNGALGKGFRLTAAGTCVLGDTTSTTFGFEIKLGTMSLGTVTSPALTTAATYHWSIEAVFVWSSSTQVRCIYKVAFGNGGAVSSSWAIETNATTVAATSYVIVPYVTQNRNNANVTTKCYFVLLEELA